MATQKIETGLIADSAVTTAKLADNSVTAAKIAAGSLDDQLKGISSSADAVAITIDSSENILVGKSATGGNTAGMQIIKGSFFSHVRDDGVVQVLNRKSSEGDILNFEKNNQPVGSIGTANSGDLYIGNDDTTLLFAGGSDAIIPRGTAGAARDGAISLGLSSHRFNNLHLAGTANVGDITINGSTISRGGSGDLFFDVGGNIQLDADDNGEIRFIDGGTQYATIKKDGNSALFQSIVADGDFIIQGIDGSSFISAVRFDMSSAGAATFNSNITATGFSAASGGALVTRVGRSLTSNSVANVNFYDANAATFPGHVHVVANSSQADDTYQSGETRFWHFNGSTYNSVAAFNKHGGLAFGSSQAAASTLDDYEEGTFSPTLSNAYNITSLTLSEAGRYTKVGSLVHFEFQVSGSFTNAAVESRFSFTVPFNIATSSSRATGMFSHHLTSFSNGRFNNGQIFQGTATDTASWVYISTNQLSGIGSFTGRGTFTYVAA